MSPESGKRQRMEMQMPQLLVSSLKPKECGRSTVVPESGRQCLPSIVSAPGFWMTAWTPFTVTIYHRDSRELLETVPRGLPLFRRGKLE